MNDDEADLPESIREHIEEVRAWLKKHVEVFDTPSTVTLSDFSIELEHLSGDFRLSLDNCTLTQRFRFGYEANGRPRLYFPMFHSPLGAPASYAAVELTPATRTAVESLLQTVLPHIRPLGLDPDTGTLIANHCGLDARVSEVDWHQFNTLTTLQPVTATVAE